MGYDNDWKKRFDPQTGRLEQNAPSSCTVDSIVGFVRSELADVTERINRGKGEWPTSNYVRDETWALWRGERMALERVLHKIESNAHPHGRAPARTVQGDVGHFESESQPDKKGGD